MSSFAASYHRLFQCYLLFSIVVYNQFADGVSDLDTEGLLLNPWWNLTFSVGEDVSLECGVWEQTDHVNVTWIDPSGQTLIPSDRITVGQEGDRDPPSYRVHTLRIAALTLTDAGQYTCHTSNNNTRSIALTIKSPERSCGFEGSALCGWHTGNNSGLIWHRLKTGMGHGAAGPRADHTYGAAGLQGHFMDVDVVDCNVTERPITASLISPSYGPHTQARCVQFWYIFNGQEKDSFTLEQKSTNSSDNTTTILFPVPPSDRMTTWSVASVDVPAQPNDYNLLFTSTVGSSDCRLGIVSLDDVRLYDGPCNATDLPTGPHNHIPVRLVNGSSPSEGRVEMMYGAQWGTLCSRGFGVEEARVICRTLSLPYTGGVHLLNATFGPAPPSYLMLEGLSCSGEEEDVAECVWTGEDSQCPHSEDTGLRCTDEASHNLSSPKVPTSTTSSTTTPTVTSEEATMPTTESTTVVTTRLQSSTTTPPTPTPTRHSTPNSTLPAVRTSPPSSPVVTNTQTSTSTEAVITTTGIDTSLLEKAKNNAGLAIGIIVGLCVAVLAVVLVIRLRKKKGKQNTYITFGNTSYSQENIPANDFSMDSPLTLSSSGYTVLA